MKPNFQVTTDIPAGNVCDVSIVGQEDFCEIGFAADPHGGPECLWFCFRVNRDSAQDAPRKLKLTLKHCDNMLGGGQPQNMRPVLRRDGEDWQRLGAPSVAELPDGRRLVSWEVDAPQTFFDFAYCYPYGAAELDALLAESNGYWRRDTFGVSPQGRPMVRLCNDYGHKENQRLGLYLLARQHSGETPGSWMLDGFLRRVAELGDAAPLVWAAPLTNIDGVENGDYGKDNFPYDLNRAWGRVPMRHETRILQDDIRRWTQRCRPVLAMDFHAPGGCEPNGIYSFVPSPDREVVHHRAVCKWAEVVREALSPEYAKKDEFARVANYPSRWETPRVGSYFWEFHGVPSLTLEVPYALAGELVFTREEYQQAGRRAADAIARQLCE